MVNQKHWWLVPAGYRMAWQGPWSTKTLVACASRVPHNVEKPWLTKALVACASRVPHGVAGTMVNQPAGWLVPNECRGRRLRLVADKLNVDDHRYFSGQGTILELQFAYSKQSPKWRIFLWRISLSSKFLIHRTLLTCLKLCRRLFNLARP
jgi:hypothetical protein